MTLLEKLNRLPPCICRIFAKKNGRLMSDDELIQATGWNRKHLRKVYQSNTWAKVRVEDVDKFLTACGLRWSTQQRQHDALRYHQKHLTNMRHLRMTPLGFQLAAHKRLIKRLLSNP